MSRGINARTHNGVVGQLGQNFVSKGFLTKDEGRLYSRLLQNRITGDYNDFLILQEKMSHRCWNQLVIY